MTTTLALNTTDAVGRAEVLAHNYQEAVLAERHLIAELYIQGRPPGEKLPIAALDRASKTRRRSFLAMLDMRLGAESGDERERVSLIIHEALVRCREGRLAAAESELETAEARATG